MKMVRLTANILIKVILILYCALCISTVAFFLYKGGGYSITPLYRYAAAIVSFALVFTVYSRLPDRFRIDCKTVVKLFIFAGLAMVSMNLEIVYFPYCFPLALMFALVFFLGGVWYVKEMVLYSYCPHYISLLVISSVLVLL